MEENTQLPVERTKDEILHSRPIVSNNKGSDLYVSLESARIAMQTYADQYATKLHQAERDNSQLKYDKTVLEHRVDLKDTQLNNLRKFLYGE